MFDINSSFMARKGISVITSSDTVRLRVTIERRQHQRSDVVYSSQLITAHRFGKVSEDFWYRTTRRASMGGVREVSRIDGLTFIVRKSHQLETVPSEMPIFDAHQLVRLKHYAKHKDISYRQLWELVAGNLIPTVRIGAHVYAVVK